MSDQIIATIRVAADYTFAPGWWADRRPGCPWCGRDLCSRPHAVVAGSSKEVAA